MASYIYEFLEDFQDDLRRYAAQKREFENLIKNLKHADNPENLLERFATSNLFKRQIGNYRVVIQKIEIENTPIYCLRKIFVRGDRDYERVFSSRTIDWLNYHPITEEEKIKIQEWYKIIKESELQESKLPVLTDSMIDWFRNENFDVLNSIYEMYEWTETINLPEFTRFRETIWESIGDIYDSQIEGETINLSYSQMRETIKLAECNNDLYVLFEKYGDILILYNLYRNRPNSDEILNIAENYAFDNMQINENQLKAYAKRAYPAYILADFDLWCKIQEDSVGNLALSPEQEALLKNYKLPLFINGPAGSGKSTMLFYLFAHLYFIHREKTPKPLFITYNDKLLETAKNSVKSILKNHPNFSEYYNVLDGNEIDYLFYPFQSYILNQILNEADREKFTKEKYVSFYKFRKFYYDERSEFGCRLRNKNRFSAELVWHVIRTYIKGSKLDEFTEEDYENLPRKDITVTRETFFEIKNTIWKNWYSKFFDEYGLWDDQDLVRYTLMNISKFPERSIIFCDEAQDFTRNEIELIFRLTIFTRYDLTNFPSIPLAFAGDPYQTINPTGFRWEALQGIFFEKFNKLTRSRNIEIFFQPLAQNYRSKPEICKFANFIQGIRLKYLDITELKPQRAYQKLHGLEPCLFIFDENLTSDVFKEIAQDTIFIVPCDGDVISEREFALKDEVLREFVKIENEDDKPIANILSSATAKGLEFDKVIVYKFGSECPEAFYKKVLLGNNLTDGEYIELSHFFNKLYVAITRAKDYLFIVDSKEGKNNFWNLFENTEKLAEIYNKNGEWRREDVNPLVLGSDKDLQFMKELDPFKIARAFEESGMLNNNPDHLIRAARYYYTAGMKKEAKECEAYAYFYSGRYLESGRLFKELNKQDEAFKSFWKGMHWEEISELYNNQNNIWKMIANYMLKKNSIDSIYKYSHDFLEKYDRQDTTFAEVLKKIKEDLQSANMRNEDKADFAKKIAEKGNKEFFDIAANFYYAENLYQQAINCWDRIGNKQHPNYYKSKLEVSEEVNDKIKWLYLLNMPKEVLKFFDYRDLNFESYSFIFDALISENEFEKALNFEHIPLSQRIDRLIRSSNGNIDYQKLILNYVFNDYYNYDSCVDLIKQNLDYFDVSITSKHFLRAIVESSNYEKAINDFIDILQRKTDYTSISDLTDIICEKIENYNAENLYFYFDIINRERKTLTENNIKILKSFSKIDINQRKINFGDEESESKTRNLLTRLIKNYIFKNNEWRSLKLITVQELASALFNCAAKFKDIISVLEFIIENEKLYSQWAKSKWIFYKVKQLNYELRQIKEEEKRYKDELKKMEIAEENKEFQETSTHNRNADEHLKNIEIRERIVQKIKKMIIQRCNEWGFEIPVSLLEKDGEEQEEEYPYEYEKVKIFGLNNIEPKIENEKKRVTFNIEHFEIVVNVRTQKIRLEDLNTNEIINIDVNTKELNGIIPGENYKIDFDNNANQVEIILYGEKIKILFE
ncbi:MAG: hypothetical protein N2490_08795 [Ignavibacteria bacterium]|nr:hypothetical protein [Ignavibacteria bacterium]